MRRGFLGWSSGTIATRFCVYTAAALLLCVSSAQAQLTNLQVHDDNSDGAGNSGLSEPASFTNPEAGKYIVVAAGRDYWGTSDDGVFLYDPNAVSDEFTAVVRHVGIDNPPTNEWGRSGIMARADAVAANSANVSALRRTGNGNSLFGGRDYTDGYTGGQVNIGPNLAEDTPFWLALSRTNNPDPTLGSFPAFAAAYAEDIGGAPGPWQNMKNRIGGPDLSGGLFLGLASQAHENPHVSPFTYENWSLGGLDPALATTSFASTFAFPVPPDVGAHDPGTLAVTEVWNNGGTGDQNAAGASLMSNTGERRTYNAPVLNILDIGDNGYFGSDANLRVVDDGGYVRVIGQTFTGLTENATGASAIDEGAQRIICGDCITLDSSTVGEIFLAASQYNIETMFFERDGGAPGGPLTLISANGAKGLGFTAGGLQLVLDRRR